MTGKSVDRILWLVADTVRGDYLGYNGGHVRTPNLDALAARSTVFDRHYAVSFPTVPARYDFLVGRAAYAHVGWNALPPAERPVPVLLNEAGITTVGIVDTPFFTREGFNYDRGFQYFYDLNTQPHLFPLGYPQSLALSGTPAYDLTLSTDWFDKSWDLPLTGNLLPEPRISEADHSSPQTMRMAEACLERLHDNTPLFCYVDTWDPHEPWDAPDYYVERYFPRYQGERLMPPYEKWRDTGWTEREVDLSRALYSGKLEMVDRWIGQLLDKLWYLGIEDSTAVIFTTDHGFYFGEHGFVGKAHRVGGGFGQWLRSPLYEEVTRIPLIIHIPGSNPGRTSALTSALDLAPTVLDLAGIEPPDQMLGRSLVPLAQGETIDAIGAVLTAQPLANPGEPVAIVDGLKRDVVEWQPVTVTTREWAMLCTVPGEDVELYHLSSDPGQATNVATQNADVVADLSELYVNELERAGTPERYLAPRRR